LERETGLEPATACLEGRNSQERRSLVLKWLYRPFYDKYLCNKRARSRLFFADAAGFYTVFSPIIASSSPESKLRRKDVL
jgi:hypothetical protein